MGARLSHLDFDACSRTLRELYAETSLSEFPDRLLPLLSKLIPSGHVSYNEFDLLQNRFVIRYLPERPDVQKFTSQFAAFFDTHPLNNEYRSRNGIPMRISDVATFRKFSETAIYQEYYRLIGTRHQVICFFPILRDSFIGVALNRKGKDFSERDRSVLAFLSPHIAQAYKNARITDALAFRLETVGAGLDAMRRAVILAGADGRIHWSSPLAREWLAEFFPDGSRALDRLPPSLAKWLAQNEKAAPAGRPVFCELHTPSAAGCRLLVYCGKAPAGEYVLALVRERREIEPAAAQSFGLTPREAEILFWISEAKTRPEMGAILGVSWRTVAKHMEQIFQKLGVENRLEAQRIGVKLRGL